MLKVCWKKDLVKIENYFDFAKRKVHDFTYLILKMLFQMTQKCPYFILLVILLEKMMTVAMLCY